MTTTILGVDTGRFTSSGALLDDRPGTPKSEQAHIVMTPPGEPDQTPQAYVMRARIEGFPVEALCGYTWIPNKMAAGLPVCEECTLIFKNDPNNKGDRGDMPDE